MNVRIVRRLVLAAILSSAVGCTSDSTKDASEPASATDAGDRPDARASDAATVHNDAAIANPAPVDGGHVEPVEQLDGAVADAARHDAAAVQDAATAPPVGASMACVTFCKCMAQNCADKVFAGGCLNACATQTKWDLPCRQNMCGLVVPQPNNDHCTHATGEAQCLDNP